jgi:predicted AlkP superfamily phosphohydrolase/phosphomutase
MDAGDSELVREWIAAGELPVLAELAERGATAGLATGPGVGAEVTWPQIVSGCTAGKNGMYNWRAIVPGTDRLARTPHATYVEPFWAGLQRGDDPRDVLLVDVPYAPLDGGVRTTAVLGWGQRGAPRHGSVPADLLERIRRDHGSYREGLDEEHGRRNRKASRLLGGLVGMVETRTRLVAELIRERPWDLCLAVYFETHYGGHAFHRYLDPATIGHERGLERHAGSLLEIYRAFDRGVGELIEAAGDGVDVIVFSGFGMRPNTNGLAVLESMMSGLGYHRPNREAAGTRGTETIRQLILRTIPGPVRRAMNRRLPEGTADRHLERLWIESTDWDQTNAYALGEPGHSHVRIARRAYDDRAALRDEIAGELLRLEDADTGAPAVAELVIAEDAFEGPHVDLLPDIWIGWKRAGFLRRVRHPDLGVLVEDMTDHIKPSEHTERGFAIAAGPNVARRDAEVEGHLVDLGPTILHMHGRAIPEDLDGAPLDLLVPALGASRREAVDIGAPDPWRGR